MAQLTTTYDKELKEKIFILKGEEGYARTTDTLLDEILYNGERREDWNTHKEYMLLEFRIDVLRDLGASQIVLYDNEDILGVYDFALGTHSIEFKYTSPTDDNRLKLSYGVEHNLYARYMGNKQCLKSTSKTYSFYEATPDSFDSSILLDGLNVNYDIGDDVEFSPTLTAYEVDSEKLIVYVDNVQVDTVTTDSHGVASVSLTGLTEGKHTISVEYTGGEYSTATSTTQDISIGYIMSMVEYPSYYINNAPFGVTAQMTNYLGDTISNELVSFQGYQYVKGAERWMSFDEVYTDSNGQAMFIIETSKHYVEEPFSSFRLADPVRGTIYDSFTITPYTNVGFTSLSASPTLISSNYTSTLTGKVTNVDIPIVFNANGGLVETDDEGNFSLIYTGISGGDTIVTASLPDGTTANFPLIEDVIKYWKAPSTRIGGSYSLVNATLTNLSNGYRLVRRDERVPTINNSNGLKVGIIDFKEVVEEFELSFTVIGWSNQGSVGVVWLQPDGKIVNYGAYNDFKLNDTIKFRCKNSRYEVYVNDVLVIDDSYTALSNARVGLVSLIDNVRINNLKFKRI